MIYSPDRTFSELVVALSTILDIEQETKLYHAWRVALVAQELARRELPELANLVFYAGLLHDLGAIGLDDHLVHLVVKPEARGNPAILDHPQRGAAMVTAIPGLGDEAAAMIRDHHERWDGSGYPRGIKGQDLAQGAILLGLADELDLVLRAHPGAPWSSLRGTLLRKVRGGFPPELLATLDEMLQGPCYADIATNVALELKMFEVIMALPPVNFRVPDPMKITIDLFAEIIDAKHAYTAGHSHRVAAYALRLARCLGYGEEELQRLEVAGLLHDFGKIAVPRAVLDKPGRLDRDELQVVRRHPAWTIELLSGVSGLKDLARDAGLHHERYDGKGYPYGLHDGEIPAGARIIAVADAFDAMTSNRPYQRTCTPAEAVQILSGGAGSQFDPEVVAVAPCLLT
ncbi:HD-GYP domain-containing protein [Moorella sp. Hama-1]|uniref:HD-GYP domain-containing protein n=1 Tax=Moorella sp. Hama-1 TaxID=2138101 RepID=UPI000D643E7F|nr:HD-GYP domain-containing protein [Moorella sp. Hama-1]